MHCDYKQYVSKYYPERFEYLRQGMWALPLPGSQYWWRANFFHFLYIQACCHLGICKYLKYTLANRNSVAKWWHYSLANIYLLRYMGISTDTHLKINWRYYVFSVRCRTSAVPQLFISCTSAIHLLSPFFLLSDEQQRYNRSPTPH